jgi:acetylornithine deacetylase/succinyl-diaminopimelate desuccinylase
VILSGALEAAIVRAGVAELAAALVRIPSYPGLPRQEEAVVRALAGYLEERGVPAQTVEVAPGRPNLVATIEGKRPGRHLVLCGHTDTVPLNAGEPGVGFSGEIRDGRLLGRGAVDMKGPVAAMAGAVAALVETGALAAGSVTLAAVVDEEMESLGAEHLIASGLVADGAVVGEPTGNRLCLAHRGLEWLEIEFRGRQAHGGTLAAGVNAISGAARFIVRVESDLGPRFAARTHPLLGPPTINFGTIAGGDQPSTVAASCRLTLDRRSLPGESYGSIVAELAELLSAVEAEMPGLLTSIRRVPGGTASLGNVALETPADHPLARAATAAVAEIVGGEVEPGAFPAWTDGALLAAFGGIPSIVLGPGDVSLAHSPREAVPLAALAEAARIYAATALAFCAGESP